MKKILLLFCLFLLGLSSVSAYDLDETFYYDEKVENMYVTKIKGDKERNGATFLLHRSDSKLVYCLDPFTREIDGNYEGYIGYNDKFGLTKEQINTINLIAYYGYGYDNHNDIKWYGITQYLIWQQLGLDDIYFTDSYYGNRVSMYQEEINEINGLIEKHYIIPEFDINTNNLSIKTEYVFIDKNNVLDSYDIDYDLDLKVIKDGNKLIISSQKEGTFNIKFIKKANVLNDYIMYYHSSSQNMFYPGKYDDIKTDISLNFYEGKIGIKKEDSQTKDAQGEATFENAIYGLYDVNDNLLEEVSLDKEGIGKFQNLALEKYYIKEIKPSRGYLLDEKNYYIDLDYNNKDSELIVYEDVIQNKFKIKKRYGNEITNNYKGESGVIFNLYDKNNNYLKTYITDENGEVSFELPYGGYVLKQINGMDNYSISDPISLSVIEDDNDFEMIINDNEQIKYGNLVIKKIGDDGKLLDGVKFRLYAREDITSLSGDVYYRKDDFIDEIIVKDGYGYLNNLYYGKYYLIEVETMDNYILDNKPVDIDINSNEINIELVNDYYKIPNTLKNDKNYIIYFSNIMIFLGFLGFLYECKKRFINN